MGYFWGDVKGEESPEYEDFKGKFKPKLTTDDCYTPPAVYDAVLQYAVDKYGLQGRPIVRPFYPGGEYRMEYYPDNCVVIDNPPFSILSQICNFYTDRGINFFLFAPTLTLFSTGSGRMNYVIAGEAVTYDNGAKVNTSFVTNLGEYKIEGDPDLALAIKSADRAGEGREKRTLAKYDYPPVVVTGARLQTYVKKGARIKIKSAAFIREMDSQKENKKAIYGGGFLISEQDAEMAWAEIQRAEMERAEMSHMVWQLSDKEKEIVRRLGNEI